MVVLLPGITPRQNFSPLYFNQVLWVVHSLSSYFLIQVLILLMHDISSEVRQNFILQLVFFQPNCLRCFLGITLLRTLLLHILFPIKVDIDLKLEGVVFVGS